MKFLNKQYIKKYLIFLNKNKDKQLHFFYIAFITHIYALLFPSVCMCNLLISFLVMISISLVKEVLDDTITPGRFDVYDILFGMAGWAVYNILNFIKFLM